MAGRAATMQRSPRWKPVVILSRSLKPVGTPVMPESELWSFSMCSKVGQRISLIQTKPSRWWLSATWKIRCSAWSRISSTSRSPWS